MAVPPINVKGTSIGFGQCRALKIAPAIALASQRRLRELIAELENLSQEIADNDPRWNR